MDTAEAEMTERHARMLGRLAELGMAVAEDMAARALAAETPEQAASLSAGFHRISRSVRQSLALEARLFRDARRQRDAAETAARAEAAASATRTRAANLAEVRARVERLVWTEAGDELTARHWNEGARRLLAEAEFTEDLLGEAPEVIAAGLARAIFAHTPPDKTPDDDPGFYPGFSRIMVDPDGTEILVDDPSRPEAERHPDIIIRGPRKPGQRREAPS